jgi:hypothetical protein
MPPKETKVVKIAYIKPCRKSAPKEKPVDMLQKEWDMDYIRRQYTKEE